MATQSPLSTVQCPRKGVCAPRPLLCMVMGPPGALGVSVRQPSKAAAVPWGAGQGQGQGPNTPR